MKSASYYFESFLPYRQSLQLGRTVNGLLELEIGASKACRSFDETHVSGIAASARGIFPDIKPPGMSGGEFAKMREREKSEEAMSEDEMAEHIEQMAQNLRAGIESGEIDIWDDTVRLIGDGQVADFCKEAWSNLNHSLVPSLKPGVGLLGDLVREAEGAVKTKEAGAIRGLRAALTIWDFARMHYEGEPPYKIVFSSQVAEALGLDPVTEKIREVSMPAPTNLDKRRMRAALSVVSRTAPKFHESLREALNQGRVFL